MTIKAIIWDLGGVLVRTGDLQPRDHIAARFGMTRWELSRLVFGHLDDRGPQIGAISLDQHWEYVRSTLGISLDEIPEFRREFFAGDVLDKDLADYVRALKLNYRTALLSNALANLRKLLEEEWFIDDAFDQIVISAEVSLVKPDPAIYQLTLDKLEVNADEAVFIDDYDRNVFAAQALGIQAIHFKTSQQTRNDLDALLKRRDHIRL